MQAALRCRQHFAAGREVSRYAPSGTIFAAVNADVTSEIVKLVLFCAETQETATAATARS